MINQTMFEKIRPGKVTDLPPENQAQWRSGIGDRTESCRPDIDDSDTCQDDAGLTTRMGV